ncbi:hypothetical protein FB45DRAFT_951655 [Roridomyces roridus]|uniref:Uncharacterized protein n=1 Tax=Roridomyces roridus TaxID=1738132 RepID=A0AAD7F9T2_9AGAR|nr:hypothetical protein FB45DRAFT_951655 [Roridomyces roridus]
MHIGRAHHGTSWFFANHRWGARRNSTMQPERRGRCPKLPISTLKPESLLPSDHRDISHVRLVRVFVADTSTPSYFHSGGEPWQSGSRAHTRFPDNTRGFFYCAPRPGLPTIASSVRFRCTPSPSPSSFAEGHDLLLPNGLPWQILVGQAAISYPGLRAALIHEGFLTPQAVEEWHTRLGKTHGRLSAALTMFSLHQLFPINFAAGLVLHVVPPDTQRVAKLWLSQIFRTVVDGKSIQPFRGTGLAQFEVSPVNPDILHLRIVKLVEPVSRTVPQDVAGGMPLPREGELFHHRPRSDGVCKPWGFNLRRQNKLGVAFRMLVGRLDT